MANALGEQLFSEQRATPLPRRPLVAYPDTDSEGSSSSISELVVNHKAQAKGTITTESWLAPSTTKATPTDDSVIVKSTTTAGARKQLRTATTDEDTRSARAGPRDYQAELDDANIDNDDETISDSANETHSIMFQTTFAKIQEADGSSNSPQCWGDIKYPRIGTCDHEFKIVNKGERYRKVVSDFFGRNKKATASIPANCYPTICRTCYQRLAYRLGSMNKDDPEKDAAAVAKLRCDAIIAALQKMKERKFIDCHGYKWPWWCGLELQLTNDGQTLLDDPEGLEAEIAKKNVEVAKRKLEKAKSPEGTSLKRLHKRVKPEYLPDWLQKLCQGNAGNNPADDVATNTIGDRNGVRYSFDELISIIKAIKTFCHESRCAFPTIEAVPVPIGLLDEQTLKETRKIRATANKMKTETKKAALDAERDACDQPSNALRKKKALIKRKAADEALAEADVAEQAVENAQEDVLLSAGTIPGKRRKFDATPGTARTVKINLNKMKAEKGPESSVKAITKNNGKDRGEKFVKDRNDDTAAAAAANDGDYEEVASSPISRPAKRARTSSATSKPKTDGRKGSYLDWTRAYGKHVPAPANAAELRAQMAEARHHGYYPQPKKDRPHSQSGDSDDE